jgi:hypothetical protein
MQFPTSLDVVAIIVKGRKLKDRQANMNGWEMLLSACMELGWKVYSAIPTRGDGVQLLHVGFLRLRLGRRHPTTIVLDLWRLEVQTHEEVVSIASTPCYDLIAIYRTIFVSKKGSKRNLQYWLR